MGMKREKMTMGDIKRKVNEKGQPLGSATDVLYRPKTHCG